MALRAQQSPAWLHREAQPLYAAVDTKPGTAYFRASAHALGNIANAFQDGKSVSALEQLAAEARLHRRLVATAEDDIDHRLSVLRLQATLRLLEDALPLVPSGNWGADLDALLQPISFVDSGLGGLVGSRYRLNSYNASLASDALRASHPKFRRALVDGYEQLRTAGLDLPVPPMLTPSEWSVVNWLAVPLFKRVATDNYFVRYANLGFGLIALSPVEYATPGATLTYRVELDRLDRKAGNPIYNPAGKSYLEAMRRFGPLNETAPFSQLDRAYTAVQDLNAYMCLLRAKLAVLASGPSDRRALSAGDEGAYARVTRGISCPYTGKPPDYNPKDRTVRTTMLGELEKRIGALELRF